MISLVVFSGIIAMACAGTQEVAVSQDTIGNYNLKYAIDGISRVEHGDSHGNVNGGFSYIDPYGIVRKTEFTSGVHGYNAIGTDIPVPVQDTPEVAHAKAKHFAALHAAYSVPRIPEFQGPDFFAPIGFGHSFVPHAGFGHFSPAPAHFASAPVHFASAPVHVAPAPVHFVSAPVHFASAPAHFASAPVHFGAHHIPAIPGFSHFGISETPEVLAARAEHFAAHAAVLKHQFHH